MRRRGRPRLSCSTGEQKTGRGASLQGGLRGCASSARFPGAVQLQRRAVAPCRRNPAACRRACRHGCLAAPLPLERHHVLRAIATDPQDDAGALFPWAGCSPSIPPMADPRFIHLRLHTEYSLLEGAMRVKETAWPCGRRGHARRGRHRHQQHVLRAGVFPRRPPRPASSPSSAARSMWITPRCGRGNSPTPTLPSSLLVQNEAGWRKSAEAEHASFICATTGRCRM